MKDNFMKTLNSEHEGAVAFEYIIIVVVMVVLIFAAWNILGGAIKNKANDVSSYIGNNGQSQLNGTK